MFGPCYRDEVAFATLGLPYDPVVRVSLSGAPLSPKINRFSGTPGKTLREGETSILWAAIPSKPAFERCSRESEGRKRERGMVTCTPRLMADARKGTEPGL